MANDARTKATGAINDNIFSLTGRLKLGAVCRKATAVTGPVR